MKFIGGLLFGVTLGVTASAAVVACSALAAMSEDEEGRYWKVQGLNGHEYELRPIKEKSIGKWNTGSSSSEEASTVHYTSGSTNGGDHGYFNSDPED